MSEKDSLSPKELPEHTKTCECGWPDGSFACKIRHIQINTGDAKASKD